MLKKQVIKAYNLVERLFDGKTRKYSGLPYLTHLVFTARTLEQLDCDIVTVTAGLLHDVIEDTDWTYEMLVAEFGTEVADVVLEVTNNKDDMKAAGGKRLYMASKIVKLSERALQVKLADRLHNVLYLESDSIPKSFIDKYYKETKYVMSVLRESGRELTETQAVITERINVVLEFLKLRYEYF